MDQQTECKGLDQVRTDIDRVEQISQRSVSENNIPAENLSRVIQVVESVPPRRIESGRNRVISSGKSFNEEVNDEQESQRDEKPVSDPILKEGRLMMAVGWFQ